MKIKIIKGQIEKIKSQCIAVACYEGEIFNPAVKSMDEKLKGLISRLVKNKRFEGKAKQITSFYTIGLLPAEEVILVGLGKKKDINLEGLRQAAASVAGFVSGKGIRKLITNMADVKISKEAAPDIGAAITEGAILSSYKFDLYKTDKKKDEKPLSELALITTKEKNIKHLRQSARIGEEISKAVYFARDLINQPSNKATPVFLASNARNMAKMLSLKCKILDKSAMEKLGMGGVLEVAKGSHQAPGFIILEYWGTRKGKAPVVLIGKGVTFDAGGICLKPGIGMGAMKTDMAGGAAVMAALMATAALKLPVNLVALVPALENMPGGGASKPGDILKTMSGKTVEIAHTDSEGRLVLADALTYAQRYKPRAMIDLATLTGCCVQMFGSHASGMLGNDDSLMKAVKKAGELTGERVWQLPLWKEFEEHATGTVADLKNSDGGQSDTIAAAIFLKNFAGKYPWVHLDIVGTAAPTKPTPYSLNGASGVGVRLIVQYLRSL